jgi:hypothetical protein
MAWSFDDTELLKKLWADGVEATAIAAQLNGVYSRNGVIGKAHRMGLERRLDPVQRMDVRFRRVCDRVIDAEIGKPVSIEFAAALEKMSPLTALRMWNEQIHATHGGDPK